MKKLLILSLSLLAASALNASELFVSKMFTDGMVLQQKIAVPIWGKATPGQAVSVTIASQKKESIADDAGKWMVRLDPLNASAEPAKVIVSSGGKTIDINDVLVGEVWLCSGQSNMDFTLGKILKTRIRDPKAKPAYNYINKNTETHADPLLRQIGFSKSLSPEKPLEECNATGWIKSCPADNPAFSAVGFFFALELRKELKVPVGLIHNAWGGTQVEPWMPAEAFELYPETSEAHKAFSENYGKQVAEHNSKALKTKHDEAVAKWEVKMASWKTDAAKLKAEGKEVKRAPRKPRTKKHPNQNNQNDCAIYNAMIAPIVPYAIKGAIWYQGESNAKEGRNAKIYAKSMKAMIRAWRNVWKQGDFSFYQVQLADFRLPNDQPVDTDYWAIIRNQQRLVMDLKNTGMAVISDIGEESDIHPKNKYDVGKRLSLWALAKDYGVKVPAYSGPLYKSFKVAGNKITLTFDEVGSGLMVGKKNGIDAVVSVDEELKRFQIAGKDKVWTWAKAKIISNDTLEVWSDKVSEPLAVRYAWSINPLGCNLYNKEGLPASSFRTDDWSYPEM